MGAHLKGFILTSVAGLVLYIGWASYREFLTRGQRPSPGTEILNEIEKTGVPKFNRADLNGQMVSIEDYSDRVLIINFWASWCDPCVEEIPSLLKLVRHFKGKLVLVAISADYEIEEMKNFLKSFDFVDPNIKLIWDKDQELARLYGTTALPESYVLGRGLRIERKVAGVEDWASPAALAYFEELLKKN